MESQHNFNEEILTITVKIKEEFPELIKYLNEMPAHFLLVAFIGVSSKNLGSSDFITGLMERHEKMAWFLRSHL